MRNFKNGLIQVDQTVTDLKKEANQNFKKRKHLKARLMSTIILEWKQTSSYFFWKQCFRYVPLKVIRQVYDNINMLQADGYHINSQAGFFVKTLKDQGYFPWRKEENEQQ